MKNVMLSAIALFLFSFAGEAKTKEAVNTKKVVVRECLDNWMGWYWNYRKSGTTDDQSIRYANSMLALCESAPIK
jgi:hypothetical protein